MHNIQIIIYKNRTYKVGYYHEANNDFFFFFIITVVGVRR